MSKVEKAELAEAHIHEIIQNLYQSNIEKADEAFERKMDDTFLMRRSLSPQLEIKLYSLIDERRNPEVALADFYRFILLGIPTKYVRFVAPSWFIYDIIYGMFVILQSKSCAAHVTLEDSDMMDGSHFFFQMEKSGFRAKSIRLERWNWHREDQQDIIGQFWDSILISNTITCLHLDEYIISKDEFTGTGQFVGIKDDLKFFEHMKIQCIRIGRVILKDDYNESLECFERVARKIARNCNVYSFHIGAVYLYRENNRSEPYLESDEDIMGNCIAKAAARIVLTRINDLDDWIKQVCFARVYDEGSLFDKDYLPLDLFRILMRRFSKVTKMK